MRKTFQRVVFSELKRHIWSLFNWSSEISETSGVKLESFGSEVVGLEDFKDKGFQILE